MKCLIIISLILLTSCGGYTTGKVKCPTRPEYNEHFKICLQNVQNDLAFMVKACDEVAYNRNKFCY